MANVLVQDTSLTAIADAIRAKNGSETTYKPGEMAAAISAIPTGGGSEVVFKNAFITPTANATVIDLSPWITDDNINDWFIYGGLPYWSIPEVRIRAAVQIFGPILQNCTISTGVARDSWIHKTCGNIGTSSQSSQDSISLKCDIIGVAESFLFRLPVWDSTAKTLTIFDTEWLAKQQMVLFYKEV